MRTLSRCIAIIAAIRRRLRWSREKSGRTEQTSLAAVNTVIHIVARIPGVSRIKPRQSRRRQRAPTQPKNIVASVNRTGTEPFKRARRVHKTATGTRTTDLHGELEDPRFDHLPPPFYPRCITTAACIINALSPPRTVPSPDARRPLPHGGNRRRNRGTVLRPASIHG